jgi:dTMP kinase
MRGKLIATEGTDASGKKTQTVLLCDRLKREGFPIERSSFPRYDTPTGKIVGGPLLGKPEISKSYFENPAGIDPKVASAYYAADRRNSLPFVQGILNSGTNLILDRYVESNMGHQGGKIRDPQERLGFFKWLDNLEYNMFELPRPNLTIFLYMPFEKAIELKAKMGVKLDRVEQDLDYLKNSEESYLQLADFYHWKKIDCVNAGELRTPLDIHEEVYGIVKKLIA